MSLMRNASIVILAGLTTPLAMADDRRLLLDEVPVLELKRAYLWCERAAMAGQLKSGAAMECSTVYEDLKWRVFDGDIQELFAWSRSQLSTPSVADRPAGAN